MGSAAKRTRLKVAAGVGAVAMLSGVFLLAPGGAGDQRAVAAELVPFNNCSDLRSWFVQAALPTVGPYGLYSADYAAAVEKGMAGAGSGPAVAGTPEAARENAAGVTSPAEAAAQDVPARSNSGADSSAGLNADAVGPGATGTNVQEAGVDEPDLIKIDGERIVVVRGERLHVLDASTDQPRKLGSLVLPGRDVTELLLLGDTAVVMGQSATVHPYAYDVTASTPGVHAERPTAPAGPVPPSVTLTAVDLSDPTDPSVVRSDEFEGSYLSAREHAGIVRLVLASRPEWKLPMQYPHDDISETDAIAHNKRVVRETTAQDWLPQRIERDSSGKVVRKSPLIECGNVSHPAESSGLGVITVLTLDPTRPAAIESDGVAADGDLVYSSTDRMYVATTHGGWVRPLPIAEPMVGGPAVDVPAGTEFVEQAVVDVLPVVPDMESTTQLHAFDVSGTTTSYVASGEVDGWLMGRWAMSEYDGNLRVATTRELPAKGKSAAPNTDAMVAVLAERGDQLKVVGSVGGLGKGEEVRAVRWFGDVATVVTFRQTDPLYTLDLSDATNPLVLGELKILGYSAYLHPIGDGLLLGVGQDATEDGRTLGTQVASFDLTDLTNPRRVDGVVQKDTWSEVEGDSRLFTYLPRHRLAIVPIAGNDGSKLWSLRAMADGTLAEAGTWRAGDNWLVRAAPVGEDRVAAFTEGASGGRVTLLDVDGLRELGSVRVA